MHCLAVTEMIWLDNLNDLSKNHIRIHQDPGFWLEEHYSDLDINQLKREMMGKLSVTCGEMHTLAAWRLISSLDWWYTTLTTISTSSTANGHPAPTLKPCMRHTSAFRGGYHQEEIMPLPKVYMDPIDHFLPSEEHAQAQGPPDKVSGGVGHASKNII